MLWIVVQCDICVSVCSHLAPIGWQVTCVCCGVVLYVRLYVVSCVSDEIWCVFQRIDPWFPAAGRGPVYVVSCMRQSCNVLCI